MKDGTQRTSLADRIAGHPLIQALSDMFAELYNLHFIIVFPSEQGWCQVNPSGAKVFSDYCRLIQSTKEGAKHCRMCHVLMSVVACSEGRQEQQCHAGATVMTTTCQKERCDGLAVLSSCTYRSTSALAVVRIRAQQLGLDDQLAEKAFRALPNPTPQMQALAHQALLACAEAAVVVRQIDRQAEQIQDLKGRRAPPSPIDAILKARLRDLAPDPSGAPMNPDDTPSPAPVLIRVLVRLIDEHPEFPFTEKDIAAAGRTTPNYLSALFRRHVGQCFSDYVGEKRLSLAKNLLGDLTLSVGEVSRKAGYDDPGYFARRFRQKTGLSPRAWRQRKLTTHK